MKISKWMLLAASLAIVPCAAGVQAVVSERTLSLTAAMEIATVALEPAARKATK